MRRCITARLTFQRLLCGDKLVIRDDKSIHEVASTFRKQFPIAPIPVPIAAALGRSYVLTGETQRVVTLLSTHPSARDLAEELIQLLSQDTAVDADTLLRLMAAVRPVSSVISSQFLASLAGRLVKDGKSKEIKLLLMREIREVPHLAGVLLRPLCEVSDPINSEDKQNVADALNIALLRSFVSPKDYGYVLTLLSRGGEHRKVLALWSWMKHTSARWDQKAVSAVIISASLSRKMNVAISAIQSLAESNEDPTIESQKYFIRYLASRFPPLSRYADQLVTHWHTNVQLWKTEARVVGVELLFAHYHSKDYDRLRELLLTAESVADTNEAIEEILKVKGMPYILRHFASDIVEEPWLQKFFACGIRIKDLGKYPQLLATLASFARHVKEEEEFINSIRGIEMNSEDFEEMAKFVADDICFRNAGETLRFISNIAEALSQQVPTGVSSWLQLLGESRGS
ncbi:uncharacterized protein TM35_000321110 [Trypanosoma theileri]|uniref:Uncharacterized protein n=1 Tax=Trypanosoma theileri TaxID=67003 RepID=A0A1X0NM47_9TRYP|nr:uncharacterized protein TM35_000321110 [Trypanosoma theileri]ORC85796.1 hypothetical protein TM35_000321110 [Trypanosoma theileri]